MVRNEETGALKAFDFDALINEIPEIKKLKCKIEATSFDEPIDSSNMQPKDWFDVLLHGLPWVLLIRVIIVKLTSKKSTII